MTHAIPLCCALAALSIFTSLAAQDVTQPPKPEAETSAAPEQPEQLEPFQARGELTDAILNQKAQLEAEALKNIFSGEKLRNINDQDTAEVLNRVPGVSVNSEDGTASGVVVRGIQPNLNRITVDGQSLGGRRGRGAGALNQIPPEFLESIEVTKAPTPDMDADAIGGTINLSTSSAAKLKKPVFSGRASSSYDDASGAWSHTGNMSYGRAFETERPSGFLISVNLQDRTFVRNRYGTRNNWPLRAVPGTDDELHTIGAFETSVYSGESQGVGLVANYDMYLSYETRLFAKVTGNSSNRIFERTRIVREFREGAFTLLTEESATLEDIDLNQNGFQVDRDVLNASGAFGIEYNTDLWEIDASIGGAIEAEESNDQTSAAFATDSIFDASYDLRGNPLAPEVLILRADENDASLYNFSRVAEIEQTEDDAEWVVQFNARRNFELSFGDLSLKAGTKFVDRTAESNEDRVQYGLAPSAVLTLEGFANPNGESFSDYSFGPGMGTLGVAQFRQANPGLFVVNESRSVLGSLSEDYDVSETVCSAYGMASLTFGPFRWIAGVRMEKTETESSGFYIDENDLSNITPVTATRDYTHWLPGVHGRYMPNPNFAVRASVTHTISRPSFRDISPYRNIDDVDRRVRSGNPDLEPYESDNIDLTFDFLVPKLGAFQAGIFYKEIDNFIVDIEREVLIEGLIYDESIEVNGDAAELIGFELAWQNEFSWLPEPFDKIETDVSYTWTSSEATLLDESRPDTVRMPDQAEHTFKASIGYEIDKWKFDISVDYRSDRFDELVRPGFDEFDSEEFSLDLGASYSFSRAWSLSLGLRNATAFDEFSYFGREDRLGRTWDSSWRGTIGLRWRL